jgi:hypothetical protein
MSASCSCYYSCLLAIGDHGEQAHAMVCQHVRCSLTARLHKYRVHGDGSVLTLRTWNVFARACCSKGAAVARITAPSSIAVAAVNVCKT